jgi:hypothetical protein
MYLKMLHQVGNSRAELQHFIVLKLLFTGTEKINNIVILGKM